MVTNNPKEEGENHEHSETVSSSKNENIWTVGNFALRDLLVYLVQKFNLDDVMDSKVKGDNWEKLYEEFCNSTHNIVKINKPQLVRKWHNWKQYNRKHGNPHPFVICGDLNEETVVTKCNNLVDKANSNEAIKALLAKGTVDVEPDSVKGNKRTADDARLKRYPNEEIGKLLRRDFVLKRSGPSAAGLSFQKLKHEISLESLQFEQEKWKIQLENAKLRREKIRKQSELADVLLQKAQTELALKKSECITMGISLE